MSWDIFVQDLPPVESVEDIPEDFQPEFLGRREDFINRIKAACPEADFSNPSWGTLDQDGFSIEFNMGDDEEPGSFAMHVQGTDEAALVVTHVLVELGLRALDFSSPRLLPNAEGLESLRKWRAYRDQACEKSR